MQHLNASDSQASPTDASARAAALLLDIEAVLAEGAEDPVELMVLRAKIRHQLHRHGEAASEVQR